MRILTLSLKNLNSLKGEWHIDFTDPAYEDSGIFAITGQTGAGKTTILDAICLALYGETPRITTISGASNEVMTRLTGDCYAEVVIAVDGKFYRCHWSQRRAYNKAEGKLQSAEHELSELASLDDVINRNDGTIIESKLSRTKSEIQALTGMDFQQFTRSVLLAQGSFSAFLKAKADERADILEKITGTDIYADISRRVYDKKRTNEQKFKELSATLDGIELLSEEEISQITGELATQKAEQQTLSKTLATLNEQINWQITIVKLNEDIASQKIELSTAQQSLTDFTPQANRLTQALKALELESAYQQLENTSKHHNEQISKQTSIKQQLPTKQSSLTDANEQLKTTESTFKKAENELQLQLPIITEVKSLDNELANSKQRLDESQTRHAQLNTTLSERKQQLNDNQQKIEENQSRLNQINDYLTENANHANLNIDRDNLINSCKTIKDLLLANFTAENELKIHSEQGKKFAIKKQGLEQQLTILNQQDGDSQKQFSTLETDISSLLNGKTINDWRKESTDLSDQFHQLNTLENQLLQLSELSDNVANLQEVHHELQAENQQLTGQIDEQKDKISTLENKLSDKEETLNLQEQVIKLEQYITTLQDDENCPLCGATDHPYLSDLNNESHPHFNPKNSQIDKLHELKKQIKALNKTITTEQNQLNQDKQSVAVNTIQLADNETQKTNFNRQINTILDGINTTHSELLKGVDVQNLNHENAIKIIANNLDNQKTQNQQAKQTCENVIKQFDKLEQQFTDCKIDSDKLRKQLNDTQNQLNELISENKLYEQKITHINEGVTSNFANLVSQSHELEEVLSHHNVTTPSQLNDSLKNSHILPESEVESLLEVLRAIAKDWGNSEKTYLENTHQKIELDKSISSLQSSLSELKKQQTTTQEEFEQLSQDLNEQQTLYQSGLDNRQKLFADKHPTDEEQRLRKVVSETQIVFNKAKEEQQTLQHNVDRLSMDLAELLRQIAENEALLDTQQSHFNEQLSTHGFADSQAFKKARLPQDERMTLQTQQDEITNQVKRLQTLLESNETSLAEQKAKKLTDTCLDELQILDGQTQILTNELAQKMGANQQKLNDNEAKQSKSSEQQQAIDKQRIENKSWNDLNQLIGSSDGKKFRIFAQGLTFKTMIQNANTQLQKMSDRYLLMMDDDEPLELNVIDNYQAGEIRSCKNLSGGESFIISLALALGLSSMASQNASKNIHVDSLFLDEGFGTLDDDSLDIALDTLTSLQQEGKLIGVISHVQALKDRILTQIKVEKVSGGISRLSGVGVRKN